MDRDLLKSTAAHDSGNALPYKMDNAASTWIELAKEIYKKAALKEDWPA